MKKNRWLRLLLFLSFAWAAAVSSLAVYERFNWEADGQVFYYYVFAQQVADSLLADDDVPESVREDITYQIEHHRYKNKRFFRTNKFYRRLFWPIGYLWILFGFVYYGGRWVRAGFKQDDRR